jgi:Flp pilus assembly protein TadG
MRRRERRGSIVVLVAVFMVVLLGFGAFAVDVSQMQAYKSELRRTADAAALAATLQLLDESQYAQAAFVAQQFVDANPVMGDTAEIFSVEYGRYQSGGFYSLPCNPACPSDSVRSSTAIRVTLRGSGGFYLAQFLGNQRFTLEVQATGWLPVTATPCAAPWGVLGATWDLQFPNGAPAPGVLRNLPLNGSANVFTLKYNDPSPGGTLDTWFGAVNLPPYGLTPPINGILAYAQNILGVEPCHRLNIGDVLQAKITGLDDETINGVSGIGGLASLCANLVRGDCYGDGGQIGTAVRVPIVDSVLTPTAPCVTDLLFSEELVS